MTSVTIDTKYKAIVIIYNFDHSRSSFYILFSHSMDFSNFANFQICVAILIHSLYILNIYLYNKYVSI